LKYIPLVLTKTVRNLYSQCPHSEPGSKAETQKLITVNHLKNQSKINQSQSSKEPV